MGRDQHISAAEFIAQAEQICAERVQNKSGRRSQAKYKSVKQMGLLEKAGLGAISILTGILLVGTIANAMGPVGPKSEVKQAEFDEAQQLIQQKEQELCLAKLDDYGSMTLEQLTHEDIADYDRLKAKCGDNTKKLSGVVQATPHQQPKVAENNEVVSAASPVSETNSPVNPKNEKEQHLLNACNKHSVEPNRCFRIMRGVFKADSGFCTAGVGARYNNCGNARPGSGKYGDKDYNWIAAPTTNNNGYFRKYDTLEAGIHDNVAIYTALYEGTSVDHMRQVWARADQYWADAVYQSLNEQ